MTEEEIKINVIGFKDKFDKANDFLKKRNVQIALTLLIFLAIVITSTTMRMSNLSLLIDQTTGNYTLSDPDALYWLRLEGRLLQTGNLDGIDTMRYPSLNVQYHKELLVYLVAYAYKIAGHFTENITYQFIDTIYPAYSSAIGLIIFFLLVYVITKSKIASLLASAFLAYSPIFLTRTISGVSGHESLGTTFLFTVFLVFTLGLKKFSKDWKNTVLWGIIVGFFITLSFASWGGTANFIFLILPLTLAVYYLFNIEEDNLQLKQKFIAFYFIFIISSLLSTFLVNISTSALYSTLFTKTGVFTPAVLVFVIVDSILNRYKIIKDKRFGLLASAALTTFLGVIGLEILGRGGFSTLEGIFAALIHPLGTDRVGLTVAYFAQPYLVDFKSQTTSALFWIFLFGTSAVCIAMTKNVKLVKHRVYLSAGFIISIIGILFSRYSRESNLNGVNFISLLVYFASFSVLFGCLLWIYYRDKHKIDESLIFTFCWMIIMLITIRAAQRTIFLVVPFMALVGAYAVAKTANLTKESIGKDRVYLFGILFLVSVTISFIFLFGNPLTGDRGAYSLSHMQAQQTGPLMNSQWQNAMSWVRNNTSADSIFLHWWDYGYLVQTAGLRTTILDGGNYNSYWDHLMGRYVLTTPNPDTALSFMKTHNVSYLLIDPTDIGKYSAFSSIGSDESGTDRISQIPIMNLYQTQNANSEQEVRIYSGGAPVDEDIIYDNASKNNVMKQIFLPAQITAIGGILIPSTKNQSTISFNQPYGIFFYNQQQISIPIKYLSYNGEIMDFGGGLDATVLVIPSVNTNSDGREINLDERGAIIYLSPKVSRSLFAQLYLLDDPFNKYPTLKIANIESDPIVKNLNSQGANLGEFVYLQGIRAPVKIWKVEYLSNIISRNEFLRTSGSYGEFDNLRFTN